MARPRKKIDPAMVKAFAQRGAKTTEIAAVMECSTDTHERRFAAELSKGRADLRMSLREWQIQAAKKGNVTMQIWLGKQYLDQKDRASHELSGPDGRPVETLSRTEVSQLSDRELEARIQAHLKRREPKGAISSNDAADEQLNSKIDALVAKRQAGGSGS
jgi:hypothetical protein